MFNNKKYIYNQNQYLGTFVNSYNSNFDCMQISKPHSGNVHHHFMCGMPQKVSLN